MVAYTHHLPIEGKNMIVVVVIPQLKGVKVNPEKVEQSTAMYA